jgi:hypothetical protein
VTERRAQVYRRLFRHLTGHESYQDAKSDTRIMMGSDGIVSDSDDEDKEESGEEAEEDDE